MTGLKHKSADFLFNSVSPCYKGRSMALNFLWWLLWLFRARSDPLISSAPQQRQGWTPSRLHVGMSGISWTAAS
jgi:hypothetical protein